MSINLTQGLFDIEATHIALVSPPVESLTFFPTVCRVSGSREKGFLQAAGGSVVPHPSDCFPCGSFSKSLGLLPT